MTTAALQASSILRGPVLAMLLCALVSPAAAAPLGCLITPARITDVGTPLAGILEHMAVDRGDVVRRGQVLATLRADTERASLAAAQVRASSQAGVSGSQASAELARQKLERSRDLFA